MDKENHNWLTIKGENILVDIDQNITDNGEFYYKGSCCVRRGDSFVMGQFHGVMGAQMLGEILQDKKSFTVALLNDMQRRADNSKNSIYEEIQHAYRTWLK